MFACLTEAGLQAKWDLDGSSAGSLAKNWGQPWTERILMGNGG